MAASISMEREREAASSPAGTYPAGGVGMRRFGIHAGDLGLDFDDRNTPALVTRLLEQCAVDPEGRLTREFFRDLSAGGRLECLLVLAAGGERDSFGFPFPCSGCALEIELELTLAELGELQREAERIRTVRVEIRGEAIEFRKPCGRDQETWAGMAFSDESDAVAAMMASLALDRPLPDALDPESIARLDQALDEADPLVDFLCRITCAECGALNERPIDLCDAALGVLRRRQKQLLSSVHRLASHYHWTEGEIFAVPHWRRMEYLALIAGEG